MAAATYPASLPDWKTPLSYKSESGVIRTQMDAGPDKVRRRYSAVPTRFQTRMTVDGDQKDTLETFFHDTLGEGALAFDRTDPRTDATEEFRFLDTPDFELRLGGNTPAARSWIVTLTLEKLP